MSPELNRVRSARNDGNGQSLKSSSINDREEGGRRPRAQSAAVRRPGPENAVAAFSQSGSIRRGPRDGTGSGGRRRPQTAMKESPSWKAKMVDRMGWNDKKKLSAIEMLLNSDLTSEAIDKEKIRDMISEAAMTVGGNNTRIDMGATIKEYKRLLHVEAEHGCAISAAELGFMYARGKYMTKDMQEAAFWFKKAAEGGHSESQYQLSRCYVQGKGVAENTDQAMAWALKASETGHRDAQYMLATGYATGMGMPQDPFKAFELYKHAASKGHDEASFVVDITHPIPEDGPPRPGTAPVGSPQTWKTVGTTKKALMFRSNTIRAPSVLGGGGDEEGAIRRISNPLEGLTTTPAMDEPITRKSSLPSFDNSRPKLLDREILAQYNVAEQLFKGEGNVNRNYSKAFPMYQAAAEAGFVPAVYKLGFCYEKGHGVDHNPTMAVELYERAYDAGDADAGFRLALMIESGKGHVKDMHAARNLYEEIAEQGNVDAMIMLAGCMERGEGGVRDLQGALEWYRKAADEGDSDGMLALGRMHEMGEGTTINLKMAASWYRKSAEGGCAAGMVSLGWCYERGQGLEQSWDMALTWYRKAGVQKYGLCG